MLPCVCSVIDHRGRQNVVRTSVTHSATPRVPLFCSYHILTSSVIYYWTDARQHGIYLLNLFVAKHKLKPCVTFFCLLCNLIGHRFYPWMSTNRSNRKLNSEIERQPKFFSPFFFSDLLEDVASTDHSRSPKMEHLSTLVKALKWPSGVLFPGKLQNIILFVFTWGLDMKRCLCWIEISGLLFIFV